MLMPGSLRKKNNSWSIYGACIEFYVQLNVSEYNRVSDHEVSEVRECIHVCILCVCMSVYV